MPSHSQSGRFPAEAILRYGMGFAFALVLAGGSAHAAADDGGTIDTSSVSAPPTPPSQTRGTGRADFRGESASSEVTDVAHWTVHSGDNGGRPFMIIDKVNAKVFVFDAGGILRGTDPALLGMARGDTSPAGIGDLRLAAIRPQDRTTPAGRYVAALDRDLQGREILWIDYDNALALHRVAKGQPSERRAQRLESATAADKRISFGCINVRVNFYETIVSPVFTNTEGIVYILPEMSPAREYFGMYDVDVADGTAADVRAGDATHR